MPNALQLNPGEFQALVIGAANQLHAVIPAVSSVSVSVAGVDLPVADKMKVLGVMLDCHLTFEKHVMVAA